jgi:peptidoglycan lytic transglycosylase
MKSLLILTAYLGVSCAMPVLSFGDDLPIAASCLSAPECFDEAVRATNRRDAETLTRRLQELIQQYPGTPWAGRASLLLGRQYYEQGDRQATAHLFSASQQLPIIGDYALYYLGEALYKAKDWNGAGTAFDLVLSRYPKSLLAPQSLSRSVEAWFQGEDCRRAKDRQTSFLSAYPNHPLQPAVLLRQADCDQKAGDLQAAATIYRQIWSQFAGSPQAQEAALRLQGLKSKGLPLNEPSPQDWWIRGKALMSAAQYEAAVAALQEMLKFNQSVPDRPQTLLQLGIARVRLKQYDAARVVLAELAMKHAGMAAQEAAVWLARVYLRQGQDEPFLELARQATGYLSGELRAKFLMLLAMQHVDRGRIEAAIGAYREAGKENGSPSTAAEASWQVGWLRYHESKYRDAVRSFEDSRRYLPTGSYGARARYWEARSLEKLGDADRARQALESLCKEAPYSYYCQSGRARDGSSPIGHDAVPLPGAQFSLEISEPKDQSIKADVHYQRAMELRLLGWSPEAAEELFSLLPKLGNDRTGILWLARLLSAAGEYSRPLSVIQASFAEVLDRGGPAIPREFWELAYPAGYYDLIRGVLPADVDPYVVTAVIREESAYNPVAVSGAGAVGLMQLMPQTAQMILAESESTSRDRLFDPCLNIRLGSRYLAHLKKKFPNNLIYVIAAYNAGPEIVSKWVRQYSDKEEDEFIDLIPYTETRNYVKKVLRSYWEYKRIYGQTPPRRILDKLC